MRSLLHLAPMPSFARRAPPRSEDGVSPAAADRVRRATCLGLPVLALALWGARAWNAGPARLFLPWNLGLAMDPWVPAHAAVAARSRWFALAAGVLWLLFLPNAPYLVTDLVHLRDRPQVPHTFDVLLFSTFGLAGCVLGWASMELVHRRLAETLGRRWAAAALATVVLLTGVGVHLGRTERWNSWDAVLRPGRCWPTSLPPSALRGRSRSSSPPTWARAIAPSSRLTSGPAPTPTEAVLPTPSLSATLALAPRASAACRPRPQIRCGGRQSALDAVSGKLRSRNGWHRKWRPACAVGSRSWGSHSGPSRRPPANRGPNNVRLDRQAERSLEWRPNRATSGHGRLMLTSRC